MKKIKISLLSLMAALGMTAVSCNDVLDITPTTQYSEDVVWASVDAVDHYLYSLYSYFQGYCELSSYNCAAFTDCYSDIMKSGSWDQYQHSYNTTLLLETAFDSNGAGTFECWSEDYTVIRLCNEFLKYAPQHMDLGEDVINIRISEARVIRAYMYYHLIRVYGGVVLRTQLDDAQDNDKARSTEAECWDYVISELNDAVQYLPAKNSSSYGRGRFTKAAVYGLCSRCALYAKRWDDAVTAANECENYGGTLAENYSDVFSNVASSENLITVEYSSNNIIHRSDTFFRPLSDGQYHNNLIVYGVIAPTSELVDSYEMADGTAFDWSVNGADPYTGRDPRFYASVIYDGDTWEDREIQTYTALKSKNSYYKNYGTSSQQLVKTDETDLGSGTDAMDEFEMSGTTNGTPTGYYFKKFITENDKSWESGGSTHFGIMLRFAEVLLNKAEALAENGKISEGLVELNRVRTRAGMPEASASNKTEFDEILRHERMIELAGEGFRYWDIRRWRIGEELLNGVQMHGVNITRTREAACDEDGNVLSVTPGAAKYEQVSCDTPNNVRYFFERYYAFSIPLTERNNNTLFGENNAGW